MELVERKARQAADTQIEISQSMERGNGQASNLEGGAVKDGTEAGERDVDDKGGKENECSAGSSSVLHNQGPGQEPSEAEQTAAAGGEEVGDADGGSSLGRDGLVPPQDQ